MPWLFCLIVIFLSSCAGKFSSGNKTDTNDLDLVDTGSANVATGYYLDRRLKNFFQDAIGNNPRGVTSSQSSYLFDNPTEVIEPSEMALLGAVDLLNAPRCKNSTKGSLWGVGVCKSTAHVRGLANQKSMSPTQSYFSLIRRIAAPMCHKLVTLELLRDPAQNTLIKRSIDTLQDDEAPSASDLSGVMTKLFGYGPAPLDLHPGSQELADFILTEVRTKRLSAGGVFTEREVEGFMQDLYKGVCLVLTHSPQMILQ
jgi:hypothetical protein